MLEPHLTPRDSLQEDPMLGIVISIIAVAMSVVLVGIQLLSLRKSIDLLSARIVEEKN